MPAKQIACIYVFVSDSNPSITYQTMQYTDASTSCECPGWVFRKKALPDGSRSCKHTRWIDCGLAEEHAKVCKRFAAIEATSRARIEVPTGSNATQMVLPKPRRNRVITFD